MDGQRAEPVRLVSDGKYRFCLLLTFFAGVPRCSKFARRVSPIRIQFLQFLVAKFQAAMLTDVFQCFDCLRIWGC